MSRREIDPADHPPADVYRLLTAVVVPRPIAWVSTRSADGVDNLAPHSFFTVACAQPPIVQFTSVGVKDTLRNVRATREFVVHLASEPLIDQVNLTGADQPAGVSEFDAAGLEREAGRGRRRRAGRAVAGRDRVPPPQRDRAGGLHDRPRSGRPRRRQRGRVPRAERARPLPAPRHRATAPAGPARSRRVGSARAGPTSHAPAPPRRTRSSRRQRRTLTS